MIQQIPTPQDDGMLLQDTVNKTASFNSLGFDMGAGFAPGGRGMRGVMVVDVSVLDFADANETYALKLQESSDNSSFTDCSLALTVTAIGVKAVDALINKRYVRCVATLGGTTPSLTYKAWLNTEIQR